MEIVFLELYYTFNVGAILKLYKSNKIAKGMALKTRVGRNYEREVIERKVRRILSENGYRVSKYGFIEDPEKDIYKEGLFSTKHESATRVGFVGPSGAVEAWGMEYFKKFKEIFKKEFGKKGKDLELVLAHEFPEKTIPYTGTVDGITG